MSDIKADIIVVAAGPAGLAAAISASECGAKVVVFEKRASAGGTARMGMGLFGVESRLQKLKQMGPTRDEAFKIFMDYNHWRADAQLIRAYIDKSATTIDWLEAMGVEFEDVSAYFPGGYPTWHIVKPENGPVGAGCAATMMKILFEQAKALGVTFFLKTPVVKILREGDKVTGVTATDESGETIQAKGKAVIIATGGFGDNPEMIKEHTPYTWGNDMFSMRIRGITGDGIRMAWEAGAASTDMSMEMVFGPGFRGGKINQVVNTTFMQPHLMVNLQGERFMDEGVMKNTTFTGNALSVQKDRAGFLIYDENIKNQMATQEFDHLNRVFPIMKAGNLEAHLQEALESGVVNLHAAGSLEELADKTGIDPEGLKKTVEQYNLFCSRGHDDTFNKDHKYLRPIEKPRFYAARMQCSAYGSLGGIKINHRTEVLDKNWQKIPGLYAAGTDACTIYGDSYPFILPGNTMGFAFNSGRIAGETAAAYVKSR